MDKEEFESRNDDWIEPLRIGIRNKFFELNLGFDEVLAFFNSSIIEYLDVGEYSPEEAEKIIDFLKTRAIECLRKRRKFKK